MYSPGKQAQGRATAPRFPGTTTSAIAPFSLSEWPHHCEVRRRPCDCIAAEPVERVNSLLVVSHTKAKTAGQDCSQGRAQSKCSTDSPSRRDAAFLCGPKHLGSVSAVSPVRRKAVTERLSSCRLVLACLHLVSSVSVLGSSKRPGYLPAQPQPASGHQLQAQMSSESPFPSWEKLHHFSL